MRLFDLRNRESRQAFGLVICDMLSEYTDWGKYVIEDPFRHEKGGGDFVCVFGLYFILII